MTPNDTILLGKSAFSRLKGERYTNLHGVIIDYAHHNKHNTIYIIKAVCYVM